jgi:hypothetical protein
MRAEYSAFSAREKHGREGKAKLKLVRLPKRKEEHA